MDQWVVYLILVLIIPVFMIIYCNIYREKAPKDIHGSNGYKTARSRLNRDTWEFANHYYNKLMLVAGWILLVLSLAVMLLAYGKDKSVAVNSELILLSVQIVVIFGCMIPTEIALKKTFDENGNRKQ